MIRKRLMNALLALTLVAVAAPAAWAGSLAELRATPTGIDWLPENPEAGLDLVVSGPDGFYLGQSVAPGAVPAFSVFGEGGDLRPAGVYVWELRAVFELDEATRQQLGPARQRGDRAVLQKAGKLPSGRTYQSGSFSIAGGQIVAGGREEPAPSAGGGNVLATKDTVLTNADGTIRNSLCVGFDCLNDNTYSDTTILLMENNTRIKFDDTSSVSGFPRNDWEIEANSNLSGGASYLGFNDCGQSSQGGCANDLVFVVEAGARQNALYVESDGDVGLGTANPVVRLHMTDGDTPALRLEQDGSSGFQAQVWDVAGNETSFFVRDATNGSTLPFRIRPGAASNSLVIDQDNDIGVGTLSPSAALHVRRTDGTASILVDEASGTSAQRTLLRLQNTGAPAFTFQNNAATGSWSFFHANNDRFVISRDGSGTQEFAVAANGDILVGGAVVHTSAREAKENFRLPDSQAALAKVAEMPILEWTYKADAGRALHLGPIAEDFYAAFGLGADDKHIALNDSIGVALLAIQGLDQVVNEKDRRIEQLEAEVGELKLLVQELANRRSGDVP